MGEVFPENLPMSCKRVKRENTERRWMGVCAGEGPWYPSLGHSKARCLIRRKMQTMWS